MTDCSCNSHGGFLTAKGLKEAEQRRGDSFVIDGVDKRQLSLYLDKVGSVSGLRRDEIIFDDALLEQQHRRFLSG